MSTAFNGYLGPILKCTFGTLKRKIAVYGCPKEGCPAHSMTLAGVPVSPSKKFCSDCGTACENTEVEMPSKPSDYVESATDNLCRARPESMPLENAHLWYPAVCHKEEHWHEIEFSEAGFGFYPVTIAEINLGTALFREKFAKEVDILQREYDKVELVWGLVHYVS